MGAASKTYNTVLANGTAVEVAISVKVRDYNPDDRLDVYHELAQSSREFYCNELESALDTD